MDVSGADKVEPDRVTSGEDHSQDSNLACLQLTSLIDYHTPPDQHMMDHISHGTLHPGWLASVPSQPPAPPGRQPKGYSPAIFPVPVAKFGSRIPQNYAMCELSNNLLKSLISLNFLHGTHI